MTGRPCALAKSRLAYRLNALLWGTLHSRALVDSSFSDGSNTPAGMLGPQTVSPRMDCFGCSWWCSSPHSRDRDKPWVEAASINHVWSEIDNLLSDRVLDAGAEGMQ